MKSVRFTMRCDPEWIEHINKRASDLDMNAAQYIRLMVKMGENYEFISGNRTANNDL